MIGLDYPVSKLKTYDNSNKIETALCIHFILHICFYSFLLAPISYKLTYLLSRCVEQWRTLPCFCRWQRGHPSTTWLE